MALDGMKTMRRQIAIQIQAADMSGTNGYRVYRDNRGETKLIARQVTEDQVESILTEREYQKFQNGRFHFRVSAQLLCETFQYLA